MLGSSATALITLAVPLQPDKRAETSAAWISSLELLDCTRSSTRRRFVFELESSNSFFGLPGPEQKKEKRLFDRI